MVQAVIRPYGEPGDEAAIIALWAAELDQAWPVAPPVLSAVLRRGLHFVAERDGVPIGFAASDHDGATWGALAALLVRHDERHGRVGSRLLEAVCAALQARGLGQLSFGATPATYLWPGVPTNLHGAQAFFEGRGAAFTSLTADMILDLTGFAVPAGVIERAATAGVTIAPAIAADAEPALAFEREHFPTWTRYLERVFAAGEHGDVLLARDAGGAIAATALLDRPQENFVWNRLLPGAGQFGIVGVAPAARSRGIGLALSARCCQIQQQRGVRHLFLGWVWSPAWYARLGFRIWRAYLRGTMPLALAAPAS